MIDLHSHVLPGIDDGPQTLDGSLALVRAAERAGTRVMVATPHASWRYPNEATTIARLTGELNERLRHENIAVEIRPGAELAMTRVEEIEPEEIERLRLGGGPWVLLEPPFTRTAPGLEIIAARLQRAGHRIVLAHPERCPALQRDPTIVESLVRGGALTSITAGSLVGRFGGEVRRFALHLVERGWVHNVASDAHDAHKRPPGITGELGEADLDWLAEWFTLAVPTAILGGEEIPARPTPPAPGRPRARRRRFWRR